ncbi:TOMM precursor leader peptide-binding protein [Geodermatophilus maliterrae]|uniref:TOMM leader peptide-binding protein n=1 Tax=Geodermatophilus maliterrae TaxID=3162531 RepID=A0ABV3XA34_9ACTN
MTTGFPRLRRHLGTGVAGDAAFLFDERGVTAVRGAAVPALARLLDGARHVDALVGAGPVGPDDRRVTGLIDGLVEAGLVVLEPGVPGAPADDPALAWWDACGIDGGPGGVPSRVTLTSVGDELDPAPVRAALGAAGVEVVATGRVEQAAAVDVDLDVVLCTDYLDPRLGERDAAQRESRRPWLLARVDRVQLWIGPVFGADPGAGCWHCLAHRLWSHRRPEAVAQAVLGRPGPAHRPASAVPSGRAAAAHLIALEVTKWTAGYRHAGQRSVWVLDTHTLVGEHHELRARPQCPSCGDPGLVAANTARPVRLRPAPRVAGSGGGDRTLHPAEMLARHRHLVGPVTGLVKQVTPDPSAPPFVHAYRSGPNLSRRVSDLSALRSCLRAENGGKGLTAVDAEVGALCEAAERHSGTFEGDELRIPGNLRSLGEAAIDPRECLLVDPVQYATRLDWNRRHSGFNHVPAPFDPDRVVDWTPLWSLTSQRQRLLPTAMLYFGAPADGSLFADSNGCAAGSSIEDAVLQGALELVERDSVALWWYNRTTMPGVDVAAFGDHRLEEMRGHHASIGRELWALDVTADLGVPTMVAVSRDTRGAEERILLGFGAHPDPVTALRRAFAEVNQMLPMAAADPARSGDPDWAWWAQHATRANQPHLGPDPTVALRRPADFAHEPRQDVRDEVETLVAALAAQGLELLVLDQTRPDVGIPVVRVVVPGLRSFWARFAPGRLFDVPVRLGRLAHPRALRDLNPVPLFT